MQSIYHLNDHRKNIQKVSALLKVEKESALDMDVLTAELKTQIIHFWRVLVIAPVLLYLLREMGTSIFG